MADKPVSWIEQISSSIDLLTFSDFNAAIVAASSVFAIIEYLRRRWKGARRARFNIYEDISHSLKHFEKTLSTSDVIIKRYEDDADPESLKNAPFYSFGHSPRLSQLLQKYSDILKEDEVEAIVLFNEYVLSYECMVADTKTDMFSMISKERKLNFYQIMDTTLGEILEKGQEAERLLYKNVK